MESHRLNWVAIQTNKFWTICLAHGNTLAVFTTTAFVGSSQGAPFALGYQIYHESQSLKLLQEASVPRCKLLMINDNGWKHCEQVTVTVMENFAYDLQQQQEIIHISRGTSTVQVFPCPFGSGLGLLSDMGSHPFQSFSTAIELTMVGVGLWMMCWCCGGSNTTNRGMEEPLGGTSTCTVPVVNNCTRYNTRC